VFITGRTKDVIIRAGRNIYPHELEELVGNIEGVRKGCVAVFACSDPDKGTERLIILAETRIKDHKHLDALRNRISVAATDLLDLPPDEVVLVPPRTVPKTSSGKIRRSQSRSLFEGGLIGKPPRALWWQITRLTITGLLHRFQRGTQNLAELAYAAWWWFTLIFLAFLAWPMVVLLPRRAWRHAVASSLAKAFFYLAGLPLAVQRETRIPTERVILVANHASYLDGAVISAVVPGQLSFVAKEELARQFVAGNFLRRLGAVFVSRTDVGNGLEDTAQLGETARAGERIVFFPEGTLTRMPGLLEFHMGAFFVAARTGTPVLPVTIRGTRSVLRGEQWFPRRGRISVHTGKLHLPDGDDFEAAVRLRDRVRLSMLKYSGEPDLAHEEVTLTQT
jgi:1-acyl-sn-glycerol-3-phosphate acyltransferase